MIDLTNIDITDFHFNNRWLSDFGGIVAGRSGFTSYSLLPSKEIKTEKIIGIDGELVTNVRYNPRTFVVPVYFSDVTRIRDIAGWLNVKKPMDFYWGKDMLKIKCIFDSAIDIQNYNLKGITELKFIAHNPYFYLISELFEEFDNNMNDINLYNEGNVESYPIISVATDGLQDTTIILNINEQDYMVTVPRGTTELTIDCESFTVHSGKMDMLHHYEGYKFPILLSGNNNIKIKLLKGEYENIKILKNCRWI